MKFPVERVIYPLEVCEYRQSFRRYDDTIDFFDPEFAPYQEGDHVALRLLDKNGCLLGVRIGRVELVGAFAVQPGNRPRDDMDGYMAKYMVRLIQSDGYYSTDLTWATLYAIDMAYNASYSDTGAKLAIPPFVLKEFVAELRTW